MSVCVSVCLFVCPSHAGFVWTVTQILNVFTLSGNPTILIFPYQTGWQYSDEDQRGAECKGGIKKSRFATNIGIYLGTDAR